MLGKEVRRDPLARLRSTKNMKEHRCKENCSVKGGRCMTYAYDFSFSISKLESIPNPRQEC